MGMMKGTAVIRPYRDVWPRLGERVFVAATAAVIGDVEIGDDCGIWFGCVLRGDVNEIRVGARTNIQDGSIVHVSKNGQGTYIGAEVTIGHMVLLHACTLADGCFIGMRATVMDDCLIESGAMLAAGALLTPGKRVPAGQLWAGAPARYVRDVNEGDRHIFARTIPRYIGLAHEYLGLPTELKE